jgi:hypothetical protein
MRVIFHEKKSHAVYYKILVEIIISLRQQSNNYMYTHFLKYVKAKGQPRCPDQVAFAVGKQHRKMVPAKASYMATCALVHPPPKDGVTHFWLLAAGVSTRR